MFDATVCAFRYFERRPFKSPSNPFCPFVKKDEYRHPLCKDAVLPPVGKDEFRFWFTNLTQTSLYRFEQKLLYNRIQLNHSVNYFLTLTIDELHYNQCCLEQPLSHTLRNWINKCQQWHKRREWKFSYAWRVERGGQSTQRLHIHMIVHSDSNYTQLHKYIKKSWQYCNWEALEYDAYIKGQRGPFAKCNDSEEVIHYIIKYAAKKIKSTELYADIGVEVENWSESMRNLKNDLKCRLVGTSRDWDKVPKSHFMYFDMDALAWQYKLKDNYIMIDKEPVQVGFYEKIQIKSFYEVPNVDLMIHLIKSHFWKSFRKMRDQMIENDGLRLGIRKWILWKASLVDTIINFADLYDYNIKQFQRKRKNRDTDSGLEYLGKGRKSVHFFTHGCPDYDASDFDYETDRFLQGWISKLENRSKKGVKNIVQMTLNNL